MSQTQPDQPSNADRVNPNSMRLSTQAAREMALSTQCSGTRDYPAIEDWLKACMDDFERGRDKHEYMTLLPIFAVNGCMQVDDITRISISAEKIKDMTDAQGVNVTIRLINRVHVYPIEDVARVKETGGLL